MGIAAKLAVVTVVMTALSCAQGHCRRMGTTGPVSSPTDTPATETSKPTDDSRAGRVFVYKYDGSLQCKMGKALSVEAMAKELNGIQIFSSLKKPDGLMHIQVCGSITGMANVYEISAQNLKKAEALGFKKWAFE